MYPTNIVVELFFIYDSILFDEKWQVLYPCIIYKRCMTSLQ
jgi:hypothetical protein